MNTLELGQKVLDLPREERVELLEKLQNSLAESDHTSPAWHGDVLNDRLAKIERGDAEFISLDDFMARFGITRDDCSTH